MRWLMKNFSRAGLLQERGIGDDGAEPRYSFHSVQIEQKLDGGYVMAGMIGHGDASF
jgi:hypothetical protein